MAVENSIVDVHLLVVDDDPEILEQARKWLKIRFGYHHLETAQSAQEAEAKLQHAYDVIIADMRMERDDSGFTVLTEVKKRNLTSVIIILTANDTITDCRKSFKLGAWDYIPKNLTTGGTPIFKVLHDSIQEALIQFGRSGNLKDREWISQNMGYLLDNYAGRYVAVLNNTVIADAAKREDLDDLIRRQNLPFYLTTIARIDNDLFKQLTEHLIVFVEGPTDVAYIKTALKLLDKEALLHSMILDTIGNRLGNQGGGESSLKNGFTFLKENRVITTKLLFLFDPDVKNLPNKGQDYENLYIRRMSENGKRGIESFFPDHVMEEGFQEGYVIKILRQHEPRLTYAVEDKKGFCAWICQKRVNRPEDFAGFQPIIEMIEDILAL